MSLEPAYEGMSNYKDYRTSYKDYQEKILKESFTPLSRQIGGNHYKKFKIQPAEFCHVNNIGYLESTAIKYLCRWRDKGGFEDLDKAIHFIELLKQLEESNPLYKKPTKIICKGEQLDKCIALMEESTNEEHWSKTGRDPF